MADKKFSEFLDGDEVKVNDQVVGLRSGANYRFDFPGVGVRDSNGNYILQWSTASSSAVNYPLVTNSITGNSVVYSAGGSDANVSINMVPKGSGGWTVNGGTYVTTIINDDSMATAAADNLSSALAIKNYVDNQIIADTGLTWNNSTGGTTSFTATVNNGYIINTTGTTTVTLPATAAVGALVAIQGSAQTWVLQPGAGQTIKLGSSSASTSLTSTNNYDCIEVICIVANTTWATRFCLSSGLTVA